jgi:hypothetical protein
MTSWLKNFSKCISPAHLSRNSKFILAPSSGHAIHNDDPELVASAIAEVIDAVSKARGHSKPQGKPHGRHRGYVFANAWVYNTIDSIWLALMIDPQGVRDAVRGYYFDQPHFNVTSRYTEWRPYDS